MGKGADRTDAELLKATGQEPEAFAVFYRRHLGAVLAYALARTGRPEVAADLTAETFAAALEQRERFDPARGPARAWLLTMAGSRLVDAVRRGRVEDRARRRMGMAIRPLDDDSYAALEARLDAGRLNLDRLVADLPADQRAAVLARVVEEEDYDDIAAAQRITPAAARQRVARGLGSLRARLTVEEKP